MKVKSSSVFDSATLASSGSTEEEWTELPPDELRTSVRRTVEEMVVDASEVVRVGRSCEGRRGSGRAVPVEKAAGYCVRIL